MPTPITRGTPYFTTFISTDAIVPVENGDLTLIIGPKYSYIPGCSVIVSRYFDRTFSFEAIVDSYSTSSGSIHLTEITNIRGNWINITGQFYMSLIGQRGSKITSGSVDPNNSNGRSGDLYIKNTGQVFIKS